MKNIQDITTDEVVSVYSGKDGKCCCGCSGKHTYSSKHQDIAEQRGGGVSDSTVSRILDVLKENSYTVNSSVGLVRRFYSVVIGQRLYVVYLD